MPEAAAAAVPGEMEDPIKTSAPAAADPENTPLRQVEVFADGHATAKELPSFSEMGVTVAGVVANLAVQNITTPKKRLPLRSVSPLRVYRTDHRF